MRITIDNIDIYSAGKPHTATSWRLFVTTDVDTDPTLAAESIDDEVYLLSISLSMKTANGVDIKPEEVIYGYIEIQLTFDDTKTKWFTFDCDQHVGFVYSLPLEFAK